MAYWAGQSGPDVTLLDECLANRTLFMSPVVLAELLSDTRLSAEAETILLSILPLEVTPGFWWRAGRLRADLRRRGYRPRLADTLIAQNCIDHEAGLLTRDRDFRPFARHAGLRLL